MRDRRRHDAQNTNQVESALSSSFEVVKPGVRDSKYREARCNDGSMFGFYIRRAEASRDWVIYFEGGGFCDDNVHSCSQRTLTRPELMTTVPEPDGTFRPPPASGLVSPNPTYNDFANANLVYAHYCSSDLWAGDTEGTVGMGRGAPWYGRGHRNAEAMLDILAESYGLDDSDPSLRVLVTGGSSGGFAVHLNASRVEAALPSASTNGRVKLVVDAGWWTEWDWDVVRQTYPDPTADHYFQTLVGPDRLVSRGIRQFWNATYDPQCEAEASPVDCLFGDFWYPRVRSRLPILVAQSSEDQAFAVGEHALVDGTPQMEVWKRQVRSSVLQSDWLFSGSDVYHTLTATNGPLGIEKSWNGTSLRTLIKNFWTGTPTSVQKIVY